MKYIRTKDGHIYEYVEQRIYKGVNQHLDFGLYRNNPNSEYEKIIAQADTIPKLCDYIRFKTKDGETYYISLKKNSISIADIVYHFGGKNIELDSVRYCIETSKGLIYVAKMNNEGVLELI